jgi:hypothetical protein
MPFARLGAPLHDAEEFEQAYPAQFICEAIDQTRGWFYSLMAVGTLVFGRSSYENVVCLGLVVDERGRKMSKHLGNVLEPIPLMEARGADAVRWFFAASGSPWVTRRVGTGALDEVVRKVLLTYWNTVSFPVPTPTRRPPTARGRLAMADAPERQSGTPVLDRWALSELNSVTADVTAAMEGFDQPRRRLAASTTTCRTVRRPPAGSDGPRTPDGGGSRRCGAQDIHQRGADRAVHQRRARARCGPQKTRIRYLTSWLYRRSAPVDERPPGRCASSGGWSNWAGPPGQPPGPDPPAAVPCTGGCAGVRGPAAGTAGSDRNRAQRAFAGSHEHGR